MKIVRSIALCAILIAADSSAIDFKQNVSKLKKMSKAAAQKVKRHWLCLTKQDVKCTAQEMATARAWFIYTPVTVLVATLAAIGIAVSASKVSSMKNNAASNANPAGAAGLGVSETSKLIDTPNGQLLLAQLERGYSDVQDMMNRVDRNNIEDMKNLLKTVSERLADLNRLVDTFKIDPRDLYVEPFLSKFQYLLTTKTQVGSAVEGMQKRMAASAAI